MRNVVVSILIALSMLSCGSSDDSCNNSFDEAFEVKEGRTYCLPDGSELNITSITDSYCACDVDCIWQGEALILGERVFDNGIIESFELHEEIVDSNPSFARISSVETTEACDPDISRIEIIITE